MKKKFRICKTSLISLLMIVTFASLNISVTNSSYYTRSDFYGKNDFRTYNIDFYQLSSIASSYINPSRDLKNKKMTINFTVRLNQVGEYKDDMVTLTPSHKDCNIINVAGKTPTYGSALDGGQPATVKIDSTTREFGATMVCNVSGFETVDFVGVTEIPVNQPLDVNVEVKEKIDGETEFIFTDYTGSFPINNSGSSEIHINVNESGAKSTFANWIIAEISSGSYTDSLNYLEHYYKDTNVIDNIIANSVPGVNCSSTDQVNYTCSLDQNFDGYVSTHKWFYNPDYTDKENLYLYFSSKILSNQDAVNNAFDKYLDIYLNGTEGFNSDDVKGIKSYVKSLIFIDNNDVIYRGSYSVLKGKKEKGFTFLRAYPNRIIVSKADIKLAASLPANSKYFDADSLFTMYFRSWIDNGEVSIILPSQSMADKIMYGVGSTTDGSIVTLGDYVKKSEYLNKKRYFIINNSETNNTNPYLLIKLEPMDTSKTKVTIQDLDTAEFNLTENKELYINILDNNVLATSESDAVLRDEGKEVINKLKNKIGIIDEEISSGEFIESGPTNNKYRYLHYEVKKGSTAGGTSASINSVATPSLDTTKPSDGTMAEKPSVDENTSNTGENAEKSSTDTSNNDKNTEDSGETPSTNNTTDGVTEGTTTTEGTSEEVQGTDEKVETPLEEGSVNEGEETPQVPTLPDLTEQSGLEETLPKEDTTEEVQNDKTDLEEKLSKTEEVKVLEPEITEAPVIQREDEKVSEEVIEVAETKGI